jgi:dienelactone hydrolase
MRLAFLALTLLPLHAQDSRNLDIPHTDTHFSPKTYATLDQWKTRRAHLQKQVLSAAGLLPYPEKCALKPEIFGRLERNGYSIEKVLIQTLPGYYLGGNLYRPLGKPGKHPGIVSPHGHWSYGRLEHTPSGSIPARAINLARQGYVVFAYDMVGYNDTTQTPHVFGNAQEQLWSFGPLGLQLWNSIRAVDFLESLPDVDATRLGATGASGGATQIFLLTAVDDRIKVAVPVNMISAIMQGGSPCENAPGLRFDTFNVEFGSMIAPRPLLMVSATGDWTRNNLREEVPAVKKIYDLYDAVAQIEAVQIDAPHNYNQASREAMYPFFAKHLLQAANPAEYKEKPIQVEGLADMLALHKRTPPVGALTYPQLFAQWVAAAQKQLQPSRERLSLVFGLDTTSKVTSRTEGELTVLSREGRGDRVTAVATGPNPRVIVVHPTGATEATRPKEAALLLTTFQTGRSKARRESPKKYHLTFNRSDDANRVQDIVTAISYLNAQSAAPIELRCTETAAIWCTFAAALSPVKVKLDAPLGAFRGTDQQFLDDFFVPGIQRAGGLPAALALLKR